MWNFVNQCQEWLAQSPSAMAYLVDERKLTPATILSERLGYFPRWATYHLKPGEPSDLYSLKGRIIVPILSEFGDVVMGIAGRVPDPKVKGWWNTHFRKSSYLYGFDSARREMFIKNKAYVFEGYFDRIALAQHGLVNSVAAMSTNLGIRRIGLVARYCEQMCLCFDTDLNDAGFLGLLKTFVDLHDIGIGVQPTAWQLTMIKLPVKVDPDEFVCEHGLDAFLALEQPIPEKLLKESCRAHDELKWRLWERQRKAKEGEKTV